MHFNFLGWHVCILYIAYHEYSMIDPSGTMISGTCCCELATFALLCESVTGLGACGRTVLRLFLLVASSLFLSLNSTLMVLLLVFKLVGFYGNLYMVFHGRVGPRRICRLYSDIVVVVYIICIYMYLLRS